MSEHTTAKLARALREIPGMPPAMIHRAVDGYYHDYLSPLATPDMQLVTDLRALAGQPATGPKAKAALVDLIDRVIRGEFDATKEEAEEWARSPEGRDTFRQFRDDVTFGGIVRDMEREDDGG